MQHNPELFALHASLVILIVCGTVVAFVLPVTVHPLLLALVPASMVSSAVSRSPTITIVASSLPRKYLRALRRSRRPDGREGSMDLKEFIASFQPAEN